MFLLFFLLHYWELHFSFMPNTMCTQKSYDRSSIYQASIWLAMVKFNFGLKAFRRWILLCSLMDTLTRLLNRNCDGNILAECIVEKNRSNGVLFCGWDWRETFGCLFTHACNKFDNISHVHLEGIFYDFFFGFLYTKYEFIFSKINQILLYSCNQLILLAFH